jgi:EAL domain-containing protein (putative c-di-GMP-specific phosphodiesterase class I)
MAVNLSARQFKQSDIAMSIFESIIESDLLPQFLEVEITESMLMDDAEISNITLKEIKEHGVHVAIDDFGTGYSSLSYLKRFHIDTLKIDQSFVRDITEDADDAAIAKTIIALGHNLRLNVIAEGVETKEQLDFLYANGCNEAQGYFFSRPLPADEFTKLLQEQSTSHVEPIMQSA